MIPKGKGLRGLQETGSFQGRWLSTTDFSLVPKRKDFFSIAFPAIAVARLE